MNIRDGKWEVRTSAFSAPAIPSHHLNRVSTGSRCGFWSPRRLPHLYASRTDLSNALGQPGPENVDRLVAAAYSGGTLVAAAGASEKMRLACGKLGWIR